MTRSISRLVWKKQSETRIPMDVHFLTIFDFFPSFTNDRRLASKTSKTGSNTSGRWYRSARFTWEERSKSPFTFPNQLQPSTTRGEGKHVTPTVQDVLKERDKVICFDQIAHSLLILCVFIRDGEDLDSQGEGSSQPDTISLASRTSQNTLDSDKVSQPSAHTNRT